MPLRIQAGCAVRNEGNAMQEMNFVTILGQIFGIIAVILGFISYQMNSQKKILIAQTATALTFCIHYLLIGATSGLVMNILAIFRNLAYYHRDKKIFSGKKCPIFFAVVMGIAGILSWQDYYSIFVVLGLVINTLCFSLPNPQDIRKSILVTSPLVLIYDIFVLSIGGAIYESVAIISSIIGIIAHNKKLKAENQAQ